MSMSDPIADMLTIIRNASLAGIANIEIFCSNMKLNIAKILKEEGYIKSYITKMHNNAQYLLLDLKYDADKKPVIHGLKRISKPGRRIYASSIDLPSILNNHGTLIISTSKGVLTGLQAQKMKVGGELICSIW